MTQEAKSAEDLTKKSFPAQDQQVYRNDPKSKEIFEPQDSGAIAPTLGDAIASVGAPCE
jgi:hypothetical protein